MDALPSISEELYEPLKSWFSLAGEKPYRFRQLTDWYFKRPVVKSFQGLANFPKALREKLERNFSFLSLSLEEAIEFINDDELVEITPADIRIRKKYLTMLDRRRHMRELGRIEDEDDE